MSVTIARSWPKSLLKSDDFPTLGSPTIASFIPPLIALPVLAVSRSRFTLCSILSSLSISSSFSMVGISSSSNSMELSTSAWSIKSSSLSGFISLERAPLSWFRASLRARSVFADMSSATASAWVRSSFPFRKALFVNSPGSARRAPSSNSLWSTSLRMRGFPWRLNSTISSPV